jgi:hypothetical protein
LEQAPEKLVQPVGALAAGRALAARLVAVEVQQVLGEPHHVGGVVEHHDGRRSQKRSGARDIVERGGDVELIGHQERHRRSARDDGLERAPGRDTARVVFDQLAQRDLHRRLEDARSHDVPAHAVQLGPAILLRTKRRVPLDAARHDERHVAERLDVVHRGRAGPQPCHRRERRLVARLRPLAFERLEQRGLLARLVGAGAAVHVDLAVEPAAEDVAPDQARCPRLLDRPLEHVLDVQELAADVDVGGARADRVAADETSLDQEVRVALHQQVILERARLALVGVADDVFRLRRLLVDELPLEPGREAGAAPPAQP